VAFSPSSRTRLTEHDLDRFPGDRLFHRLARVVCRAGCLPRKELYEAWETGRRVRRLLRGGRVLDVGGGHGLLAHVLLLLDDTSPSAIVADPAIPPSAPVLHAAIAEAWPRLAGRVTFQPSSLDAAAIDERDLVVSIHACGALTDRVIARAADARARVAVVPCCHDAATCDTGPASGWLDADIAIDVMRAVRLEQRGYRVRTLHIPASITPKNRLLVGSPIDTE
jgi:Methyltransferase domain